MWDRVIQLLSLNRYQRGAPAAGNGISKILSTSQVRIRFATNVTIRPRAEKNAARRGQDKELVKEDQGEIGSQLWHERKWLRSALFLRKEKSSLCSAIWQVQVQCVRGGSGGRLYMMGTGSHVLCPNCAVKRHRLERESLGKHKLSKGAGIFYSKSLV